MKAAGALLIVEPTGRSGCENMAMDVALLRAARAGAVCLRLYRWAPPCLSFGRNEAACARYDRAAIERLGLATVRRPTGGRAVWHDREVTYAVAGPAARFGSLRDAYRTIHELLAAALRRLGVPAEVASSAPRAPRGTGGACFSTPVGGEVVACGRKLVGSAQLREDGAVLQHGSILLADGQDLVTRVTRGAAPPTQATSLAALLGRAVGFDEVAQAIAAQAAAEWTRVRRADAPAPAAADRRRFADPGWTWRR